jgi:hypothetical protein
MCVTVNKVEPPDSGLVITPAGETEKAGLEDIQTKLSSLTASPVISFINSATN